MSDKRKFTIAVPNFAAHLDIQDDNAFTIQYMGLLSIKHEAERRFTSDAKTDRKVSGKFQGRFWIFYHDSNGKMKNNIQSR